jgi:hypothetical protein
LNRLLGCFGLLWKPGDLRLVPTEERDASLAWLGADAAAGITADVSLCASDLSALDRLRFGFNGNIGFLEAELHGAGLAWLGADTAAFVAADLSLWTGLLTALNWFNGRFRAELLSTALPRFGANSAAFVTALLAFVALVGTTLGTGLGTELHGAALPRLGANTAAVIAAHLAALAGDWTAFFELDGDALGFSVDDLALGVFSTSDGGTRGDFASGDVGG